MLPFLKRKESAPSTEPIPEIQMNEEGETEPIDLENEEFLSGLGDDEFNINNEEFMSLVNRIVLKHLHRMK